MSILVVWVAYVSGMEDGSAEAAEFWHVITAGTHESGRITEVSYTQKENLSLILCNDHGVPFKVIGSGLDRHHKTGTSGEHHIFPHVNNPFLCFYYNLTLAYTLVVSSGMPSQWIHWSAGSGKAGRCVESPSSRS